jgi:subtilisin family serine protease
MDLNIITLKKKEPTNQRVFSSDDEKTIHFRGEYSEFKVSKTSGDIIVHKNMVGSIDLVKVTDLITNETNHYKNTKFLDYQKDLKIIPITKEEPIPVAVTIDVDQEDGTYSINVQDILKHQIDLNTDKFKITSIYDSKGGIATLENGQINFIPDENYKEIMSFRYLFENEYGQSSTEKTPVLLRTPDLPKDDKFIQQLWYLEAIHAIPVWDKYTGKGIKVAVYDSGFFPKHSDIDNNVIHRDAFTTNEGNNILLQHHALQVASIIASERNDKFYVGIAYDAKIGSYQAFGSDHPNHNDLSFFLEYDVINNSWGLNAPFSVPKAKFEPYIQDFKEVASSGRDGLGSIITFSSGNSGGSGSDSNCDVVKSTPYTITIGGINKPRDLLFMEKQTPYFASHGANILVSAPASNICLLSSDNFEISNNLESQSSNTINTQGTSFSAPIVSGVIALMLEANPKLGYRDVQEILASSATKETNGLLPQWAWKYNKADTWNGGGQHFSHQYGFGKVNAQAAVKLAESWPLQQTIKTLKTIQNNYQITRQTVASVDSYEIETPQNGIVEHVEQSVNIAIKGNIQDVNLYLTSPQNTTSKLMYNFLHNPVENERLSSSEILANFKIRSLPTEIDWNFGSTNFRGEGIKGKWTLSVEIKNISPGQYTPLMPTEAVYVNSLNIKIYSKAKSTLKQMIYTDEFKASIESSVEYSQDRQTIFETQKIDIINGAALSSGIEVDLDNNIAVIAQVGINLDKDIKLKGIIGTDHDDKFVISDNQKLSINLNEGNDVVEFSGYNNTITLQKHSGIITINHFEQSFVVDTALLQKGHCWQLRDNFESNIVILDNSLSIGEYYE